MSEDNVARGVRSAPSRLLIAGYYGYANTGDEAILAAMLQDLRALRPDLEVVVVSGDPEGTAARHRVQSVAANDIPAILDAAQAVDAVLLGGGGIFHDYWGCPTDSLLTRDHVGIPFYGAFPLLAGLTGRPCMIYAVGVGPLLSAEGSRLTRATFAQASLATVRDEESLDILRKIGVNSTEVRVTADPAFGLRPDEIAGRMIMTDFCSDPGRPRVALCLRPWETDVSPVSWAEKVAVVLDAFIEQTGAFLVFVPFHTLPDYEITNDVVVAERVADRMTARSSVAVLRGRLAPEVVAGVVAACDLVVGMRLHSLVFAAIAAVPAVGLVYDPKVLSVMRRLGLEDYAVPLGDIDRLGERMAMAWQRREEISAELAARSAGLRQQAAENATLAVSLLDAGPTRVAGTLDVAWLAGFALGQTRKLAEQQALAEGLAMQAVARAQEIAARTAELEVRTAKVEVLTAEVEVRTAEVEVLTAEVEVLTAEAEVRTAEVEVLTARAEALTGQVTDLTTQVSAFRGSAGWQLAEALRGVRRRVGPPGTRRDRVVRVGLRVLVTLARQGLRGGLAAGRRRAGAAVRQWLTRPRGPFAMEYPFKRFATVTLYTDRDDFFPGYAPRRSLSATRRQPAPVTLIATTRNERASVHSWMASVAAQTRPPDEIVIVDAGSTDGTPDELRQSAAAHGMNVTVLVEPGANIARGRNRAIEQATSPILACTDFGGRLTPTWLERIVAPFADDPEIQVVGGWYVTLENGRPQRRRRWPTLDEVDPGEFLPSSRSIAFTREAWTLAGGYPEWLTLTGEDTWFALELGRFCERWAFVPEAVVEWEAPGTMTAYWAKIYAWSIGDGEAAIQSGYYWRSFRRVTGPAVGGALAALSVAAVAEAARRSWPPLLLGAALLAATVPAIRSRARALGSMRALAWEGGAEVARVVGFLRGVRRRPEVTARRLRGARGLVFMLSGVPIDDTGGGARCTQIALELLKQEWFVVFVSRFPRHETRDLGLRIRHPRLLATSLAELAWRRFIEDHRLVFRERPVAAILEFPLAEFVPVARAIRHAGGAVVYDLLDRWDSSLGAPWYSPAVERTVIALSDVLVATAPVLAARLQAMSGRDVALLPNAVNTDLFVPDRPFTRPDDYPRAPWSMIYIGALWGDWFDWALLRRVAVAYPEAAVVLIGDYRGQMASPPANVRFLGLKPQAAVPAYLAHADVAIVPWKINAVTDATSPLKVYEYLAMRRPVVAPRLEALAGIPGLWLAADAEEFVQAIGQARRLGVDHGTVSGFVQDNSWTARVTAMLRLIQEVDSSRKAGT